MLDFIRSDIAELAAYAHPLDENIAEPIDRLHFNESPYDLPVELKDKLAWIYQHQIFNNRYPDSSHSELKEEIALYINEEPSCTFTADNISIGNGSDELIRSILIATCLRGEGSILVANPTFSMYGIIAQTLGIPTISIPRNETNFEIDLDLAQKAIATTTNPPIRVVFVVHPNSPTANALTPKEIDWLKHLPSNILVVIDEAYFEFSKNTLAGKLANHSNWIITRTFSKAFRLATHRIGYAIAHSELINALESIRLPFNLPTFTQTAALVALKERDLLLPSIEQILTQKAKLYQNLSKIERLQLWQSDSNFIYARIKNATEFDYHNIIDRLQRRGTLIRYTGGGLRITVGTPEECDRALERTSAEINSLSL
jgi:histidinol-phosphate aminotransferase